MSVFKKIRGTLESLFQIGKNGPNLKDNSGVLEVRNTADSAYAKLRADHPVDDNDVATKKFVETLDGFVIVSAQEDTSTAIPNNTAVKRNIVVTTFGNGVVVGDLLYDDGSNSGVMEVLAAFPNRTIATTQAFTGGTITLEADSIYTFDADLSVWTKIGDIGSVVGASRVLRYAVDNSPTQDSVTIIPANSIIHKSKLIVDNAYDGGTDITIGKIGSTSLLQAAGDNNPTKGGTPNEFHVDDSIPFGTAGVVRTTVTNTPAAGDGFIEIYHTVPQA